MLSLLAGFHAAWQKDAIARLDEGTYGTCQMCCAAVEWERLEAVPSIRLCWQCHSATQAPRTDSASTLQHLS
jgi:RNA polymerase-binding transcription factor DksA